MPEVTQTSNRYGNFIGGGSRPGRAAEEYERCNPSRPDEVVGRFALSDEYDVEDAVVAAHAAQLLFVHGQKVGALEQDLARGMAGRRIGQELQH